MAGPKDVLPGSSGTSGPSDQPDHSERDVAGWGLGLVATVLGVLALVAFSRPQEPVQLTWLGADSLAWHYPTWEEALTFGAKAPTPADDILDNWLTVERPQPVRPSDTLATEDPEAGEHPLFYNPLNARGKRALDAFYAALAALERGERGVVRVAHYGDSQIEGDRVSTYIRSALQQQFGGNGMGLVPFFDVANHQSITRKHSGNWRRYEVFQHHYRPGRYSYGGMVFRFVAGNVAPAGGSSTTDAALDSLRNDTAAGPTPDKESAAAAPQADDVNNPPPAADTTSLSEPSQPTPSSPAPPPPAPSPPDSTSQPVRKAWVEFRLRSGTYGQLRLAYGKVFTACQVEVLVEDEVVFTDSLLPDEDDFHVLDLPVKAGTRKFRLRFAATQSPEFYGLLLDPLQGIQVDNFGIRGHTGNGLIRINFDLLAEQLQVLNTRLIILQYGGNAVPATDVQDWTFFEDAVYRQVRRLQRANPRASILVVSVSDAASQQDGTLATTPTVPKIRNAQYRAAVRAKVAFWDLYQEMGGRNSILSWVERGLAARDYAHFGPGGQKLVAERLVQRLLAAYAPES